MSHPLTDAPQDPIPSIVQTVARIRAGLRRRSNRSWSVLYNAPWNLIRITAYNHGRPAAQLSPADAAELAHLLGYPTVGAAGVSCRIVAADIRDMIDRANGAHPCQRVNIAS